jgi:predicted RNA-binding Zn-ribbon protein involved in translation (DUF1610 family)
MDDDDRDEPKRRPRQTDDHGRRSQVGAPRGRGLGAPTAVAFKCAVCGTELKERTVEPGAACPSCGKPLHTCTNCSFFDTSARFECRKPIAKRIESKAKANDCELYEPKQIRDLRAAQPEKTTDARSAFDALFKK